MISAIIKTIVEIVTLVLLSKFKKGITGNDKNSSTENTTMAKPNLNFQLYFLNTTHFYSNNYNCIF